MAKIRVGVKRIQSGTGLEVLDVEEPGVEVFQQWVEINGVRFYTDDVGLLDVTYGLGRSDLLRDGDGQVVLDSEGRAVREYPNNLTGEIVVRFSSHGFETVDHRVDPPLLVPHDS